MVSGALSFPAGSAVAQGLHNESSIHIGDVSVFVDGSVSNEGFLRNDGQLTFTNDWESAGPYSGSGTLEAIGNGAQKIVHFNQEVSNLYIQGWGTKYINGQIRVANVLRLTSGIVHVSSKDRLSLHEGARIEGGSADSHVDGAITVQGTGYKFFPVGKNGTYAPIEFLDVSGKEPEFSVEVFDNAPTLAIDNVIVQNSLYWQRTDLTGDFASSPVSVGFEEENFSDPTRIIMLAGVSWDKPFMTITQLDHSTETRKVGSRLSIAAPVIMLGQIADNWHEADFYLSTALSPNAYHADNRNVRIFGDRLSGDQFNFAVFNRWGNIVFETNSLDRMSTNGWDGRTADGNILISGTYPYRLTAYDKTGRKFEKTGVITIIH